MARVTDPADARFFQSERFFTAEGQWYFATREGVDFGPFSVRNDGEKALQRYLDTQRTMRRLRGRDPVISAGSHWSEASVARAAREVADWRLDRSERSDTAHPDRSDEHK
jgi:hypothetical protein